VQHMNRIRIIYTRTRGENEPPVIKMRIGGKEYTVNAPIEHPDWKSREFNEHVRRLYQAARTAKLVESNHEICDYLHMDYRHFEVWLTRAGRRLPDRYGSEFLKWWNEELIRKPPQIAAYLFSKIHPKIIVWSQTFQKAIEEAKGVDILCVVTDEKRLVALLNRNTIDRILEEMAEEHIHPKRALAFKLEQLDCDRRLLYDFTVMRWDSDNAKVLQELKEERFAVIQDEKGKIEGVVPPFPSVLTYAPSPPFAEVYSSNAFPEAIALLHIKYIVQPFLFAPKTDIKVIDIGTGPGTFALAFAEYWMKKHRKGKIRIDAVEREEEKIFKTILETSVKAKELAKAVVPRFQGVENLTVYDDDYDLAVWHLVLPYRRALETLPAILKSGGTFSICYFDGQTMNEINKILVKALSEKMLCIPELKLLTIFRSEVLDDLNRFVDKILPPQVEREFACSLPEHAEFENAEAFLKFWFCASPLICGVLSTFDEYPLLKDRVWKVLLDEINEKYGPGRIKQRIFVNFVIGKKKSTVID
jgi:SAM-dependent methyltransferase